MNIFVHELNELNELAPFPVAVFPVCRGTPSVHELNELR